MKSNCINCGSEIIFNPCQKTGKFCNNICQRDYQYKIETKFRVERGEVSHPKTLKRYLIKERTEKCEICELTEWMNKPIVLALDHIDGNSDNNLPSNIRLICPNCHSQTPTFSGRNKTNSKRSDYRKRYRIKKLGGPEGI